MRLIHESINSYNRLSLIKTNKKLVNVDNYIEAKTNLKLIEKIVRIALTNCISSSSYFLSRLHEINSESPCNV